MTKNEAILKAQSGWWETATPEAIVDFQLYESRLCMPFDEYHKAIEKVFRRPVWTHEFADQKALQAEYEGRKRAPSMSEIIELLPTEKTIVVMDAPKKARRAKRGKAKA